MAKIFVTRKIPNSGIKLLKKHHTVKVFPKERVISKKELLKGVKWCDALLCLLTDKIDAEIINANSNLKIIANYAVGYDNIDINAASAKNIPVTNTPGVLTDAVAEYTLSLILSLTRRIPEADSFTRAGKYKGWEPMLLLGPQLKGKTVGIIGFVRIGFAVAQMLAKGMGVNIIYSDTRRHPKFEKKYGAKYATISSLLKKADVVSLHVPLLPSTKHLIGASQFKMMKKTAYLINTSRGPVVDEKALVKALKRKQIAGAALDVFEYEPKLVAGLAKLRNVIVTPHIASATLEARSAMSQLAAKNILTRLANKVPPNILNKEVLRKRKT